MLHLKLKFPPSWISAYRDTMLASFLPEPLIPNCVLVRALARPIRRKVCRAEDWLRMSFPQRYLDPDPRAVLHLDWMALYS